MALWQPCRWLLITWLVALLSGCQASHAQPDLLQLTDLEPRAVSLGDRVDLLGRELPVGQVDEVTVVFRGRLLRAGHAPLEDRVIEITDATLDRDRVSFLLSEAALERFVGRGQEAVHTTFVGRVELRLVGAAQKPVQGALKGDVALDVTPPEPARKLREQRLAEAQDAASFLGWELAPLADPTRWGVSKLDPSGPAAKAGAQLGDEVVSVAGVSVLSAADALPAAQVPFTPVVVSRGEARLELVLETRGYRGAGVAALMPGVIVLATLLLLGLAFGSRFARWLSWLTHRLEETIARHRVADGSLVAALLRAAASDARRGREQSPWAVAAPAIVFAGVSIMFASLPFLELRGLELDVGMLYLLSVTALLSMGVLTGGWGAGRARLWGRVRALVDLLVCQLPALCALLAVVLATGSLRVRDIVAAQSGAGAELGLPWAWNALRSPHLFLLFSLFFMTALVDGSRSAEPGATTAKQAGSAGFFFAEWMHLFVMCALGAILFLGGYGLPFVSPADLSVSTAWKVLGATLFLVKCWALLGLVLVLRAALPRLRPDTVLRLGVSLVLPSCTVALALAFLASRFPLLPEVERSLGLLTLFMVMGVAALLVGTVLTAPASSLGARFRARTNPLL